MKTFYLLRAFGEESRPTDLHRKPATKSRPYVSEKFLTVQRTFPNDRHPGSSLDQIAMAPINRTQLAGVARHQLQTTAGENHVSLLHGFQAQRIVWCSSSQLIATFADSLLYPASAANFFKTLLSLSFLHIQRRHTSSDLLLHAFADDSREFWLRALLVLAALLL